MRGIAVPATLVAGTLGLALGGGVLAAFGLVPLLVLAVPVGIAVPVLALRNLGIGAALLPVVGAAVPIAIGTGTQSKLVAALLFSGFLLTAWIMRGMLVRGERVVSSPVVLPTLALIAVWILAYLCSNVVADPLVVFPSTWQSIQLGGLSVAIIPAGILLLCLNVGVEVRWIKLATWSFLAVGAIAVVTYYVGLEKAASVVLETGGLFTMWVVALAYGQALFNDRLPNWLRLGLLALVAALVFKAMVLQTWWFSGWLPAVVVLTVITFFKSRKAFGVLLALTVAVCIARWDAVYDAVWGTTIKKGDLSRLDIWQQTFSLVGQYPLLGTGPAGYAAYFQSLYAGSQFSMSTHSNYLDVLAETGIVGCVVFAAFLGALVWVGWQARRRWKSGFAGGYAQGAFGGLIGLVLVMSQGDWFIPFVYNQTIAGYRYTVLSWVFLGFLASLAALRHQTEVE
jgi:O-antigen ligase